MSTVLTRSESATVIEGDAQGLPSSGEGIPTYSSWPSFEDGTEDGEKAILQNASSQEALFVWDAANTTWVLKSTFGDLFLYEDWSSGDTSNWDVGSGADGPTDFTVNAGSNRLEVNLDGSSNLNSSLTTPFELGDGVLAQVTGNINGSSLPSSGAYYLRADIAYTRDGGGYRAVSYAFYVDSAYVTLVQHEIDSVLEVDSSPNSISSNTNDVRSQSMIFKAPGNEYKMYIQQEEIGGAELFSDEGRTTAYRDPVGQPVLRLILRNATPVGTTGESYHLKNIYFQK